MSMTIVMEDAGASSSSYCAVSDVTGLGSEFTLPSAWSSADVLVAIEEASRRIDMLTKDYWSSVSRSYYLSGDGTDLLLLTEKTRLRLVSVTQIQYRTQYDATDNFDDDGEEVDEDTYVITSSRRGIRRVGYSYNRGRVLESGYSRIWVNGVENYKVTATFGHANVPDIIKRICVLMVRERIQPQYCSDLVSPLSEKFPDGYQYTAPQYTVTDSTKQGLTGIPAIDNLLWAVVNKSPKMVVP